MAPGSPTSEAKPEHKDLLRGLAIIRPQQMWSYDITYVRLVRGLLLGLTRYFIFYNGERPHHALVYKTQNVVFATAYAMRTHRLARQRARRRGNGGVTHWIPKQLQVCQSGTGDRCLLVMA